MTNTTKSELERQIAETRRTISSDGYPMSIGELTNLYRDNELIIRPEFQRFFRWTDTQKSRLVESLLLGIPLPSIFVAQTEGGKWELVDGLQRVSTILQLQGELRGADPLVLRGTKYLPALEGLMWNHDHPSMSLTEAQRLDIKRTKIDIKIIKRESSPATKFDLFERLNSYGSPLTAQEMRSALLVAVSPEFFAWLERLSEYEQFRAATLLNERLIEERFDLELIVRFLVLHAWPTRDLTLSALRDFTQVLDNKAVELAGKHPRGSRRLQQIFEKTFDVIANAGGDKIFRRWDPKLNEFKGSFLSTAFEVFGLGIGYHIASRTDYRTDLLEVVKKFWCRPDMQGGFATGKSTERRLVDFVPLGRELTARTHSNA